MRVMHLALIVCSILLLIGVVYLYNRKRDEDYALEMLKDLGDSVPSITKEELEASTILISKTPDETIENFSLFSKDYWPRNYYHGLYQNGWLPGMYTNLRYWNPGFRLHGWTYHLRPGVRNLLYPQNRWVRHQGSYYYIHN